MEACHFIILLDVGIVCVNNTCILKLEIIKIIRNVAVDKCEDINSECSGNETNGYYANEEKRQESSLNAPHFLLLFLTAL